MARALQWLCVPHSGPIATGRVTTDSPSASSQLCSAGNSNLEIHHGALALSQPRVGLSWLDIGCGTGEVLREVRERFAPTHLEGVDIIDWLAPDLSSDVVMTTGPAEEVLLGVAPADRVLLIEVIEHLEAPWSTLRLAARLVRPGGRLVLTTPNLRSLRHRLELLVRGQLTCFRPDNLPHLTPALPHVIARVLQEEGLEVAFDYVGRDSLPGARRLWPWAVARRAPQLSCISLAVVGERRRQ